MFHVGTLVVRPQSAKLTISTETFGKMDPYVKISCGSNNSQTAVAEDQHKTPTWSDSFVYKVTGEQTLTAVVWEKDNISKDDLIGETTVQLSEVYMAKNVSKWYELRKGGQVTGQLLISFEYYPEGQAR